MDALANRQRLLEEELEQTVEKFGKDFGPEKISLKYAEAMSAALTRSTWTWFLSGLHEGQNEDDAIYDLQGQWLLALDPGDLRHDHDVVYIHWGREILPDLVAQWDQWPSRGISG